jgi:2-methylisocitrate lyase-like PEP mutase family enzyme
MSQAKKAKYFASLHKKGAPIVLYNAWDSGIGESLTLQLHGNRDRVIRL